MVVTETLAHVSCHKRCETVAHDRRAVVTAILKRLFSGRRWFPRQCSVYVGGATLQIRWCQSLYYGHRTRFFILFMTTDSRLADIVPMLRTTATRFLFRFIVNNDYVPTGRRRTVCAVRFLFHLTGFLQHSCGQKYALDVGPCQ